MPDAWTILKENSSLGSGDVWDHLNNPKPTSSGGGGFIYTKEPIKVALKVDLVVFNPQNSLIVGERIILETETNDQNVESTTKEILEVTDGHDYGL